MGPAAVLPPQERRAQRGEGRGMAIQQAEAGQRAIEKPGQGALHPALKFLAGFIAQTGPVGVGLGAKERRIEVDQVIQKISGRLGLTGRSAGQMGQQTAKTIEGVLHLPAGQVVGLPQSQVFRALIDPDLPETLQAGSGGSGQPLVGGKSELEVLAAEGRQIGPLGQVVQEGDVGGIAALPSVLI